jgi:DNA-binding winged helix-turn-helix (wHTH) protein/Flp pilus assembly protein TadD
MSIPSGTNPPPDQGTAAVHSDMAREASATTVRFGEYEVDLRINELRKSGARVNLQRQPFAILAILLERPGDIILRDELRQRLWRDDVFVDFEHSVNRSINKLREALEDSADAPRLIETIPGRGYRFVGQIVTPGRSESVRIAVLPVENATGNPENDYLTDGITEALIDALGQQLSGLVRVTALASVLRFRRLALPIHQVAAELGADRVLAGRLRRTPQGLRIRLELVDVKDHAALWVNTYSLSDDSDLRFCDEVPTRLASSLDVSASGSFPSSGHRDCNIAEAHQAYLRGRYFWNQRTGEAMKRAIEYFRWAAEKDPGYAPAYVGLAESYIALTSWGAIHPREAIAIARESSQKALEIDHNNAEAHVAMAWSRIVIDSDWPRAEQEFQTAISLNPSNPLAYHWYAYFLMAQKSVSQSLDMNRRALDVDPLSAPVNALRGWLLYCATRYEDAAVQLRRTCELEVNHPAAHGYLTMVYEQLGRHEESINEAKHGVALSDGMPIIRMLLARAYAVAGYREHAIDTLAELEKLAGKTYLCSYYMALVYAALERVDATFVWLNRGCDDAEVWTIFAGIDPRLVHLHSDRRFAELMQRVRFRAGVIAPN